MIIGYFEDGPNLVSMAMNGWGEPEPAWWLNLQANPEAVVELAGGVRRDVIGRAAAGPERDRLWQRWRELDENLDSYAARRTRETAVVVLSPARPKEPSAAEEHAGGGATGSGRRSEPEPEAEARRPGPGRTPAPPSAPERKAAAAGEP